MELRIDDAGTMFTELELGMSHTGRNNLAETPLLKVVGDLRWLHMARLTGVDSRDVKDDQLNRLYATFFYVDVVFPERTPMAHFGENDHFTLVNTIQSVENNSMLDGYHFLYPAEWPDEKKVALPDGASAVKLGIPYVRTSNTFVLMFQGASWLKKGVPAHPGMSKLPRAKEFFDSYTMMMNAHENGRFKVPPKTYSPLNDERMHTTYQPLPDRDLNGVGLLYFANYPTILDLAERELLSSKTRIKLDHHLLDLRTVVRRQSAYLSNVTPDDSVDVYLDAWIENPWLRVARGPSNPIRLFLNFEMYRRSDRRKMMVSTVEKVIFGKSLEDAGLMDELKSLA